MECKADGGIENEPRGSRTKQHVLTPPRLSGVVSDTRSNVIQHSEVKLHAKVKAA